MGRPEAHNAVILAVTPGIGTTEIFASTQTFTNSYPGSDIAGIPASVTRAMAFP